MNEALNRPLQAINDFMETLHTSSEAGEWVLIAPTGQMWTHPDPVRLAQAAASEVAP